MKKLIFSMAAITLLATGCSSQNASHTKDVPSVIKIGFIGPLSGDAASYGVPSKDAIELAKQEINETGGINGSTLEIVYEDGKCDGKGASAAIRKLIDIDKVQYIIGGFCSGETLAAAPVAEQNKVILFSSSSGSPDITHAGDFIFRNFPSDASSATKLAKLAKEKGMLRVATLTEITDYAQAFTRTFSQTFEKLGGLLVTRQEYESSSKDFRSQLTKVKASDADAILVIAQTPEEFVLILKQVKEIGIDLPLLSNEFLVSDMVKESSSLVQEGYYAEPLFDETRPATKAYMDKYQAAYQSHGSLPPVYIATAYDAVYIAKEAIEASGLNTEKIRDYLYGIKNREGAAGTLSIDANGDAEFQYVVKEIRNGVVQDL